MNKSSLVIALIGLIAILTAAAVAERYTLETGWILEANLSSIPVSNPMKLELPAEEIATITWLIFPPSKGNNATMLFVAWGNYSDLDVALGVNAVTTSIFGSMASQLGATYFNTNENTRINFLDKERYGVEAYNETTREVKGYYIPVSLEAENRYLIITLWATNISSQQWSDFLNSISLNQTLAGS